MRKQEQNPYYQGPVSDHFDGVRFFLPDQLPAKSFKDLLRWRRGKGRVKWPKQVQNKEFPLPQSRLEKRDDLAISMIGHATTLVQYGEMNILTDPLFSTRTSPLSFLGPKRVRPPGIAMDDLPPIDVILLSHNHYDHMDLPALKKLKQKFNPKIITPLGNGRILRKFESEFLVEEGDWYDSFDLASDIKVTLTPARHWSKRTLHDRNMALWSAFVIEGAAGSVYFAGDTGFGKDGRHFDDVYERFGAMRASLIPIGAYEPRWFMYPQHINPDEAVRGHLKLHSQTSIAIHHGTVQLTDEAIDQPVKDLNEAQRHHKISDDAFLVLEPGETAHLT